MKISGEKQEIIKHDQMDILEVKNTISEIEN